MHELPPFNRISFLRHFTDGQNLASIRAAGGLLSTAQLRSLQITSFRPGGNDVSLTADRQFGMDRSVHLCFNAQHPLAYLAQQDGRITDIKWLWVRSRVLDLPGVLFCPNVANRADAVPVPIAQAAGMIDFDILYTFMDWKNDMELRARRQAAERAEILVPDFIPFEYFSEYFPNG